MLSLVIPTYNETENLPLLLPRVEEALHDIPHEVIIVDDNSPDGTWRRAQELAQENPALRVIRREGERGLSSAVVAGFRAARGEVLAAMDADGQHDSALIGKLYAAVQARKGIAVASRYVPGGGMGQWNERRQLISRIGTRVVGFLFHFAAKDPLSGFFAIDRALFERIATKLRPRGFKILFDLLVRVPRGTPIVEVPYTFAPRLQGRSKLSLRVHGAFIYSLLCALFERFSHFQWLIFLLTLTLVALVVLWRLWAVRLLVFDPSVRERTREAYVSLSEHEGWLISDLSLRRVEENRVEFLYRPHGRNAPPAQCIRVRLDYFGWYPCDAS
jgi:dolichol-phosphate mannosyltransferase